MSAQLISSIWKTCELHIKGVTAGQQYADSVMSKASKFQADIDTLNGN